MFKINKKLEYAFIALKHMVLKKNDQLTTVKEICDLYKTPFDPTARGLQLLAQKGIIRSGQGINGGYRLTEKIKNFSLKDFSEIIIGPIQITDCQKKKSSVCERKQNCLISNSISNLNK